MADISDCDYFFLLIKSVNPSDLALGDSKSQYLYVNDKLTCRSMNSGLGSVELNSFIARFIKVLVIFCKYFHKHKTVFKHSNTLGFSFRPAMSKIVKC